MSGSASRVRTRGAWIGLTVLALAFLGRLFTDDGTTSRREDDSTQEVETVGELVTQPPRYERPHVSVEHRTDVVDGEIIEVVGTGFRGSAEVEIRQCADDLGCIRLEPVETDGDPGTYRTSFHADDAGTFTARVAVRRYLVGEPGAGPVDCSAPAGEDRCNLTTVVYFTGRSQYPSPVKLHFTDAGGGGRPTVVADSTSGLVDGQKVRLVGIGFVAGSVARPVMCPTRPGPCVDLETTTAPEPVRADGTVELEAVIPMRVADLDCRAPRACTVSLSPQVSGGFPTPAPLPLSFAVP